MRMTSHAILAAVAAALLRNQGLKRPTWEDMQQVRDRLRELASG